MYAFIWRKLPFGVPGKLLGMLVLLSAVGVLLWYVVFPWATPLLPFDDVQVGTSDSQYGPAQQDPNAVIPGDDDAIPYSTESNAPHPSPSR